MGMDCQLDMLSDEDLMHAFAGGNFAAFQHIFDRYSERIYNYFLANTGNIPQSEDLTQECFLRLTESRQRYQSSSRFSSWLFTIAINLIRDRFRQKRRWQLRFSSKPFDENGADSPRQNAHPHNQLQESEISAILRRQLSALPSQQREAILLSKYHGFSFEEIGDMLGISAKAAKQKAYRGLKTLRARLAHLQEEINNDM